MEGSELISFFDKVITDNLLPDVPDANIVEIWKRIIAYCIGSDYYDEAIDALGVVSPAYDLGFCLASPYDYAYEIAEKGLPNANPFNNAVDAYDSYENGYQAGRESQAAIPLQ
jgi:hypothetical protein